MNPFAAGLLVICLTLTVVLFGYMTVWLWLGSDWMMRCVIAIALTGLGAAIIVDFENTKDEP